MNPQDEGDQATYYDAVKAELAERAARTKAALDALDPATRVAMEVGAGCGCSYTAGPAARLQPALQVHSALLAPRTPRQLAVPAPAAA